MSTTFSTAWRASRGTATSNVAVRVSPAGTVIADGSGVVQPWGRASSTRPSAAARPTLRTTVLTVTERPGRVSAGVAVTDKGAIVVDEHLRTTAESVWALGDVNGGPQFTYVSLDDFRIVRDQLVADGRRTTTDRRAVPTTTFITPPLAHVGLTEQEAVAEGFEIKVASKRVDTIAAMPRARIVGDTRGMIKVVVDAATDHVLGATVFCVDSREIINLLALAMRHDVTATELRDTIYTHPSSTEALNEVLTTI